MKTRTNNEALERVFNTLSPGDIQRVNVFLRDLGVSTTVWDPVIRFHFQLAVAAVIEEIRTLEVGTRTLNPSERETLEALLGL